MNSDVFGPAQTPTPGIRTPRPIFIIAAIYAALLIVVGIVMVTKDNGMWWILTPQVAFAPAVICMIATFGYGRTLFGTTGPQRRALAWSHLTWATAAVYAVPFVIFLVLGIFVVGFRELTSDSEFRQPLLVIAITLVLLALWARIGSTIFARDSTTEQVSPSHRFGLAFVVGAVMMLSSVALNVDYSSTGWSALTWQGAWVTNEFMEINALRPWIRGLTLAAYAVGILLALLALAAGVMCLARRSFAPKIARVAMTVSIVVFWFTLTNYQFDCFYLAFVGIFNFMAPPLMECAIVTAAWLTTFAVGTALWFKYSNRRDDRSRTVRTALVLWALPLMPLTISTFWYAANWELYGLVLYVAGLQIVTACWWKAAGHPREQQELAQPSTGAGAVAANAGQYGHRCK